MIHATRPQRVLVPVDMSEASAASLTAARGVADRFGAKLTVVFVDAGAHWVRDTISTLGAFLDTREAMERRTGDQLARLREFVGSTLGVDAAKDVEVRLVENTSAADTICAMAKDESFDWICMSAVGDRGWRRLFVGSTAAAVVRQSPVPVLTLRKPEDGAGELLFHDMRNVLVAADLTETTAAVVGMADAIAGDSGRITLMHVVESVADYGLYGTPVTAPAENVRLAEEWSRRELEKLEGSLQHAACVGRVVATGRPAREILDLEEQVDPDLLVLGTHSRTGMDRLAMGSVAESVVRQARGPVLVVPTSLHAHADPVAIRAGEAMPG